MPIGEADIEALRGFIEKMDALEGSLSEREVSFLRRLVDDTIDPYLSFRSRGGHAELSEAEDALVSDLARKIG